MSAGGMAHGRHNKRRWREGTQHQREERKKCSRKTVKEGTARNSWLVRPLLHGYSRFASARYFK
jgi:hypothetical protein